MSFNSDTGLQDFSWQNIPIREKRYQMTTKYYKWKHNITDCYKNAQMPRNRYMQKFSIPRPTKIYQNWYFWFENKTIWQPWLKRAREE
jgi:hypothetical protein